MLDRYPIENQHQDDQIVKEEEELKYAYDPHILFRKKNYVDIFHK